MPSGVVPDLPLPAGIHCQSMASAQRRQRSDPDDAAEVARIRCNDAGELAHAHMVELARLLHGREAKTRLAQALTARLPSLEPADPATRDVTFDGARSSRCVQGDAGRLSLDQHG